MKSIINSRVSLLFYMYFFIDFNVTEIHMYVQGTLILSNYYFQPTHFVPLIPDFSILYFLYRSLLLVSTPG
jgi:hypothetical protein